MDEICVTGTKKKAEENPFTYPNIGGPPTVPDLTPTGEEPGVGENPAGNDGDDEEEEPYCRQDDEAVDELAKALAQDLAERCFSGGVQSGPEGAYVIYRDGPGSFSVGDFCSGDSDGVPNMGEVDLRRCVNEDGRTQHDVVGTIHCGFSWSTVAEDGVRSDEHALNQFGRFLESQNMGTRTRDLRFYKVEIESGEPKLVEKQYSEEEGCEEDAND